PPSTRLSPLSLHDALPIWKLDAGPRVNRRSRAVSDTRTTGSRDGRENREGHKEARRLELVGRGRTRVRRRGGRLCRELAPLRAYARAGQEPVWMVERALGRRE